MVPVKFVEMWFRKKIEDIIIEDLRQQDIPRFGRDISPPSQQKIDMWNALFSFFQSGYYNSPSMGGDQMVYEFCQWFIKEHDLIDRQSKPQRTVSRYEIMEIK